MTRLVIVDHGIAVTRLVKALIMYKDGDVPVTVIGEEPRLAYNWIQLSPVLGGEKPFTQTLLHPAQWYLNHGMAVLNDEAMLVVDATSRSLTTTKRLLLWDELILTTRSYPFIPPIPDVQQPHVHALRTMRDVKAILRRSKPKVVLGGDILGVEAMTALRLHGDDATLIHRTGRLMEQQLSQQASDLLQAQLTGRGIRYELSSGFVSIEADCITLLNGQHVAASGVVIATGVKPNITLAQACGVVCRQGIVVDEQFRTPVPGTSTVGECCETSGQTWGLVAPCPKQAKVLATRLTSFTGAGFGWQTSGTCFKVTGIDLFGAGVTDTTATDATLSTYDPLSGRYRHLLTRDGELRGMLLIGDCRSAASLTDLLAQEATAHSD